MTTISKEDVAVPDVVQQSGQTSKDNKANIYQLIWESDTNQFSVSPRNVSGEWENSDADILLDEQVKATGKREIDLATRPLFYKVNEDKLFDENRTYVSFIQLLDNYAIRSVDPEFTPEEEEQEQNYFLAHILKTKPIQLARKYINREFGENLSDAQFQQKLKRIWFELYTNYYKGEPTNFCSGFEHIFVGESEYDTRIKDKGKSLGEVYGYHSWVKFYLDEKNQRVNYLGYKYDLKGQEGPVNPNVITLQQTQNITDMRGNVIAQLFKKKGTFFVGPSPECEIAMGTVAYYESVYGRIRDKRRVNINGATYDLVIYRNVNPDDSRGELIRSFFPVFIALDETEEPDADRPVVVSIDYAIENDGSVVITAALPNPEGEDTGKEWVELQNTTNTEIALQGWELQDKLGRSEVLSGTLQPQKVKRFTITCSNPNSMRLGNRSGLIVLLDNTATAVGTVRYDRAESGEVIHFQR